MKAISTLDAALAVVDSYSDQRGQLELPLADELLDDVGLNMAIILDRLLSYGWSPNGYDEQEGYRIYRYVRAQA